MSKTSKKREGDEESDEEIRESLASIAAQWAAEAKVAKRMEDYVQGRSALGLVSVEQAVLDDLAAIPDPRWLAPLGRWAAKAWRTRSDAASAELARGRVEDEMMEGYMELLDLAMGVVFERVDPSKLAWEPTRLEELASMREVAQHVLGGGPEPKELAVEGNGPDGPETARGAAGRLAREARMIGRSIDRFTLDEGFAAGLAACLNDALGQGALAKFQARGLAEMGLAPGAGSAGRPGL